MPGADWIPVISQVKTGVQFVCWDFKGGLRTQKNFMQECIGFSQLTSIGQLVFMRDEEGAWETQKCCFKTIGNIADGTPGIGHIKGGVHHAVGDHKGGNQALYAATRPVVILGGASLGALATGGPGAIPAGIASGMSYDAAVSLLSGKSHGCCAAIDNLIENPDDPGAVFDAAFMGYSDFNFSKGHNTTVRDYRRRIDDVRVHTSRWIASRNQERSPIVLRADERPWTAPRAHGRRRTSARAHECPCTACREHRRRWSPPRSDERRRTDRRSHGHHRSYDEYY